MITYSKNDKITYRGHQISVPGYEIFRSMNISQTKFAGHKKKPRQSIQNKEALETAQIGAAYRPKIFVVTL